MMQKLGKEYLDSLRTGKQNEEAGKLKAMQDGQQIVPAASAAVAGVPAGSSSAAVLGNNGVTTTFQALAISTTKPAANASGAPGGPQFSSGSVSSGSANMEMEAAAVAAPPPPPPAPMVMVSAYNAVKKRVPVASTVLSAPGHVRNTSD